MLPYRGSRLNWCVTERLGAKSAVVRPTMSDVCVFRPRPKGRFCAGLNRYCTPTRVVICAPPGSRAVERTPKVERVPPVHRSNPGDGLGLNRFVADIE